MDNQTTPGTCNMRAGWIAQLPNESAKAFAAFQCYIDMGTERSTAKVGQKLGKSRTVIQRWSKRHGWVRRSKAHQEALLAERQEAESSALKDTAIDWARRQMDYRAEGWDLARQLIDKAKEVLQLPLIDASPVDACRLIEVADKLSRLSCGMPTKNLAGAIDVSVANLTPEAPWDPAHIRSTYMQHLRREVEAEMAQERQRLDSPEPS